jgi:hypothetical protein
VNSLLGVAGTDIAVKSHVRATPTTGEAR